MALGGVVALTQQDFMDLVARLLPYDYLAPLLNPGPGGEIYQAQAAIGARVSQAVYNFQLASFIVSAPDGGKAVAPVVFSRPNAAAGTVVIKAGTVVSTPTYGRQFSLMADATLGPTATQVQGFVQAAWPGEQYNVAGPYTTKGGERVAGEISQIVTWVQQPPFGDPTVTVANPSGASGGISSVLNIHGGDRGFVRGAGELAVNFRQRVRALPDTVSPQAIRNAIAIYQAAYPGTVWDYIETWQPTFQEAFDCPSPNPGVPFYSPTATLSPAINTNLFAYDGPTAYPPFANRWLDELDYRGAFIVTVPVLAAIADAGMAYDDTAQTAAALNTTNGRRAANAYDVPQNFSAALQGFYDGQDFARNAVYAGLYATLQRIKGAGILAMLEIQGM